MKLRSILIFILLTNAVVSTGQSLRDVILSPTDNGKILSDILREAERQYNIDVIFEETELRAYTIGGVVQRERLTDFLDRYLVHYQLFRYNDKVTFIINRAISQKYALKRENFLLFPGEQNTGITLRGSITDGASGEPLINAKVFLPASGHLTTADVNGEFELKDVRQNVIEVNVEYVGYEPNHYLIGFSRFGDQQRLSVKLQPESRELESVTVTADRIDENVTARVTGVENMSITTLKSLPSFLGEVDPIRSLTTLPGVSTPGELAAGFNVRGGEAGQNLVTQDGATIYNPSHLFGFFSAFNPDLVNSVTLYKGGGPAKFGSRISSILDVSLRNGNASRHLVSGGVGLASSRLTAEGPLLRNRSSYLVGARISYANWLLHSTNNISLQNSAANFYDITGKIFHTINEKNFLTFSGYHSYDDFKLATDSVFSWKTTNFALRWDHTFKEEMFSTVTLTHSNYASVVHSVSEIEGFKYSNEIQNITLKAEISSTLSDESKISGGIEATAALLEPGQLVPADQYDNVVPEDMQDQRSLESAIFLQWEKDVSRKWSIAAGVRYGYFLRLGKEDIYTFDYSIMNGRYPSISDTISYGNSEIIKQYSGIEPRISIRYMVNDNTSLKASYYRGFQYLHMISNTTSTTPQDYWIASGPYLRPQSSDQYSLGVFHNMKDNQYEVSLEGYYRDIKRAVDYMEGADITLNPALEAGLAQGEGLAYGTEFMVKKTTGRTTGWISYTWSRSLRRFRDGIVINDGEYYPSNYDQPHRASLVLTYYATPRSVLSLNFNYATGRPITIPVSKFSYDVYLSVLNYSQRNDYRIPDYHRLDLSWTIKDRPRNNKRWRSEWVVSVFNVYSRKNAYSIEFSRYGSASKLSVLGSIFPSVSYNFRF